MKRIWALVALVALLAGTISPAVLAQGPVTPAQPTKPSVTVSTGTDPARAKEVEQQPEAPIQPEAVWPGPDGYSYVGSSCTYNWVDISSSGTPIPGLTDDNYVGPFDVGFDFSYYGTSYSQFYVGSNGFLSFGGGDASRFDQCPLPNSSTPNNLVALMWDDLYPNYTTGGVYYQYFASCPFGSGECLVVEFNNWYHCCSTVVAGTFEAVLYPTGQVVMQYLDGGAEEGSASTTGIEGNNAPSDYGLTYVCDTAGSIIDNTCISMDRPLNPNYGSSYKSAAASAMPGDTVTYVVTVRNGGAGAGNNTTMVDPIPDGMTFAQIVSPPELTYNAGLDQVEWNGQVGAGESIDLIFEVTVDDGAPCGTPIVNTATISDPGAPGPVDVSAETSVYGYLVYGSDFEGPQGGGFSVGGTTSFAWGTPTSGPGTAHSGVNVWATNLAGPYSNYEDGWIESPVIDLSPIVPEPGDPLLLDWWQWLQTESCCDDATVEARGGGVDWTPIYGPVGGDVDLAWAMHSVDISSFAGAADFQIRFHFTSDLSVVYPGWYVDDVSIHMCSEPQPGLYLAPGMLHVYGCNGEVSDYTFSLFNNTGSDGTFDLAYAVPTGNGTLTGPASLTVVNGERQDFDVTLSADLCAAPDSDVVGTIDADGNGFADSAVITKTITAGGNWATVPSSAPSWAGIGYPGDGCTALNASGEWVTYILGDVSGITGFWGYNLDTNTWFQPSASNTPADRWAPDWAYDDENNICYVTGGANTPGAGTYNTAYAYDPVANAFTQLPSFTAVRDFHDSWVGYVDGTKYLCIGGGNNSAGMTSTQCYDIIGGTWAAENATIPAYPVDVWAAADGTLHAPGGDQFWVVGGVQGGGIAGAAAYFDDADNAWHSAGDTGLARYRVEGDFFNGEFYQIGGSTGNFDYTPTAVKGSYNGSSWTWTQLADAPNGRMDNVVAATPDSIWSVDGYGSAAANYVDYLLFCPSCDLQGWLQGTVLDGEIGDVACQNAQVHIDPVNMDIPVDPATGAYGPVILNEGVYEVTAVAPGYVGDTAVVTITDEMTETQDFSLWRAVVDVSPYSLSVIAAPGFPVTRTLDIDNLGHEPLDWEIHEIPPSRLVQGSPFNPGQQAVAAIGVDPYITDQFAAAPNDSVDFFVAFWDTADLSGANSLTAKADKIDFVRNALRTAADAAQANVRAFLDSRGIDYKVFYIDNTILVHSNQTLLADLARFPEVAGFHGNHTYSIMPVESDPNAPTPDATIPWDIQIMQIDRVWDELGVTGAGVIVANVDTGVYYQHEALIPNYLCSSGPHDDCWFDPDGGTTSPNDGNGHGTETMSQMAADNDPAFQYSVGGAPDAGWVACLGCPGGSCPDTALNGCADWIVMTTPNTPDIVNNSWGTWSALCDPWYDGKIAAYRAAGIVPVWAAGNIGNACGTSTPPANSIGTLAVGATTSSDVQASFSSTGPGLCSGRTQFPDLSAPGENTCAATNAGGYTCGASGTSFASPRAAGCAALLKSADPSLTVDDIMNVLMTTADNIANSDCGSPQEDPNYRYGEGRINCYNAVASVYQQDIQWVSEDPIAGTVPPQDGQVVDVVFTCAITDVGNTYTGTLRVTHNDPCQGSVDIPLELTCIAEQIPDIDVTAPPLDEALCPDAVVTDVVSICNVGAGNLDWSATGDTWLTPDPDAGTVGSGGCMDVDVLFDSTGLAAGQYLTTLDIASNDPDEPLISLPVTMTVGEAVNGTAFTFDPVNPVVGQVVSLSGSAQGDEPIAYAWDLGDGITATGALVTHAYTLEGVYTVALEATNGCGSELITQMITVTAPVTCTGVTIVSTTPTPNGCTATFSAELTGDEPFAYLWDLGAFGTSTDPAPLVDLGVSGTYPYTLTVTNCGGLSSDTMAGEVTVSCLPGCDPVTFIDLTTEVTGCVVTFTPAVTGTTPYTWEWAFGDGVTSTEEAPVHDYGVTGVYSGTATVWNCEGTTFAVRDFAVTVSCAAHYEIYLPLVLKNWVP